MSTSRDPVETILQPLDRLRGLVLRLGKDLLRPLIVGRELRIAVGGCLLMFTALCLTGLLPFWMLALGPIFLGVPHVVSDIRYLVVRTGVFRRREFWWAAGIPLVVAGVGGGVIAGLTAAAGVLLVAEGSSLRRWTGLLLVGCLLGGALLLGRKADLLFAHFHNFMAVILWWWWRQRDSRLAWIPMLTFVGLSLFIFFGGIDALVFSTGSVHASPAGMNLGWHASTLAPGMGAPFDLRLVLLFAFAQSVHYTIWLRMIPDEDRPQPTPRTFGSSYRALRSEMGRWFLWLAFLSALAVAIWAVVDLAAARIGYLRMAIFHGHLELAAAALFWMEGNQSIATYHKGKEQTSS